MILYLFHRRKRTNEEGIYLPDDFSQDGSVFQDSLNLQFCAYAFNAAAQHGVDFVDMPSPPLATAPG